MGDDRPGLAEVKARLAEAGADVHPEAKMTYIAKPESGATGNLVAVERVADIVGKPDYCIHGYATCIMCDEFCYLGSKTQRVVSSGEAYAICLPCAKRLLPGAQPTKRVHDRRR